MVYVYIERMEDNDIYRKWKNWVKKRKEVVWELNIGDIHLSDV